MRPEIRWGLYLASSMIAWTMLLHVTGVYSSRIALASSFDAAATIIPVLTVVGAVRERRLRMPAGAFRFHHGFSTGLLTVMVSWPLTAAFMLLYHRVIHPEWLDILVSYQTSRLTASGASAAEVMRAVTRLRAQGAIGTELFGSLIGTLLLALILSSVVAFFVARSWSHARRATL